MIYLYCDQIVWVLVTHLQPTIWSQPHSQRNKNGYDCQSIKLNDLVQNRTFNVI